MRDVLDLCLACAGLGFFTGVLMVTFFLMIFQPKVR